MATPEEAARSRKLAEVRRELQRRSLDQLLVYNPLTTPFSTQWDGFYHTVKARGERPFPRYIAEKWMREWIDAKINDDEKEAVAKENERRRSKGWNPLNPEERNDFDSAHGLLISNEPLRMKYLEMIYRGISEEHGMDMPETQAKKRPEKRPLDERLLAELDAKRGTVFPEPDETEEVEELKESFMEDVSSEE